MGKWQAAYWGDKGVDIYQVADKGHTELLYSGSTEGLKKEGSGWQRRILILGRGNTIRLRKRYPPMNVKKLQSAIEIEAPDIFPMKNSSFHCRIAETDSTHIIANIWAWEREETDKLQTSFPFQYVIPEELAFLASPSGVYIYAIGSIVQVIAAGGGRFLDAASFPATAFSATDMALFLAGLADNISSIGEIRFYGNIKADVPPEFSSIVKKIAAERTPPFLEALRNASLKPFKRERRLFPQFVNANTLLRFAVYGILAYGLMLFFTLHNYDKAIAGLRNKSLALDKEIGALDADQSRPEEDIFRDIEARKLETVAPLKVLGVLAAELPEETCVKGLTLNQGMIEATISSRDPMALLKKLSGSRQISKISLKGSPVKDSVSGIYNSNFSLEIKP